MKERALAEQLAITYATGALSASIVAPEDAQARIAAIGAASLAVALGADREGVPIAACQAVAAGSLPLREDQIVAELAPLLWRLRYAAQHEHLPRARELFGEWLATRRRWREERLSLALAHRLAGQVLHEWLADRCSVCAGSGKQERSASGRWIRPRGAMQRNATYRPCCACSGSGRAPVRHIERMRALEISQSRYDAESWPQRFAWAHCELGMLVRARRLFRQLRTQLERR